MQGLISRDAERFQRIAEILQQSPLTSRDLAARLDISQWTLRNTLAHLSEACGEQVVETAPGGERLLTLTDPGKALLNKITEFVRPISEELARSSFTVAVSQTMLTSGLLDGVLTAMQEQSGSVFNLRAKTQMAFREIVSGIEDGEIDYAIVWGVRQRLKNLPERIHVERITPEVDVVVVAHDRAIVDLINPVAHWFNPDACDNDAKNVIAAAMGQLRGYRCATLPQDSQAVADMLPEPDIRQGGQRVEVDTIEAAISFVRCAAADFAVMPAIYDRLEREQQDGKIIFSDPIAQVPIIVLARKTDDSRARTILDHLLDMLRRNRAIATWRERKLHTDRFPRSLGFYRKLRYGYYIGADAKSESSPLEWCWETIRLDAAPGQGTRSLKGLIVNQFQARFDVTQAEFRDSFFIVQAKRVGRSQQANKDFLSRFHYCDFQRGIICGTWSGNSHDNRPGVFATVWSHQKLDLDELTAITRTADLHSVMSASHGCEDKDTQFDLIDVEANNSP